jgi:hypothetical protein
MQYGVFDPADILVNGHPMGSCLTVEGQFGIFGVGEPEKIP